MKIPIASTEEKIRTCFHCGNKTLMKKVAGYNLQDSEKIWHDASNFFVLVFGKEWGLFFCPVCSSVTLEQMLWNSEELDFNGDPICYPETLYPSISLNSQNMPKGVHDSFEAALKVRNMDGAICALSLRRTLEKMCKDKGQTKGSLYDKLNNLSKAGILPPILDQMAFVLKELGNAAAHGDDAEFPPDLVASMIEFTQIILDYVYILPQKLSKVQGKIGKSYEVSVTVTATSSATVNEVVVRANDTE